MSRLRWIKEVRGTPNYSLIDEDKPVERYCAVVRGSDNGGRFVVEIWEREDPEDKYCDWVLHPQEFATVGEAKAYALAVVVLQS